MHLLLTDHLLILQLTILNIIIVYIYSYLD